MKYIQINAQQQTEARQAKKTFLTAFFQVFNTTMQEK